MDYKINVSCGYIDKQRTNLCLNNIFFKEKNGCLDTILELSNQNLNQKKININFEIDTKIGFTIYLALKKYIQVINDYYACNEPEENPISIYKQKMKKDIDNMSLYLIKDERNSIDISISNNELYDNFTYHYLFHFDNTISVNYYKGNHTDKDYLNIYFNLNVVDCYYFVKYIKKYFNF